MYHQDNSENILKRKIENNKYTLVSKIGEGAFGKIFTAVPKISEHYYNAIPNIPRFAIKVMQFERPFQSGKLQNRMMFKREVAFHHSFGDHKNIAKLYDHYTVQYDEPENTANVKQQVGKYEVGVMVFELLNCDLFDFSSSFSVFMSTKATTAPIEHVIGNRDFDCHLTIRDIKFIFKEICQTVQYLHSNNIAHCDIKPENILINYQINDGSMISVNNVKLCDFGYAVNFLDPPEHFLKYCAAGTIDYMSPECYSSYAINHLLPPNRPFSELRSTMQGRVMYEKFDIWSLGVTLFVIMSGCYPFKLTFDNNTLICNSYFLNFKPVLNQSYHYIRRCIRCSCEPSYANQLEDAITNDQNNLLHLLSRMFEENPETRASINEVLEHPWLSSSPLFPSLFAPSFASSTLIKKSRFNN